MQFHGFVASLALLSCMMLAGPAVAAASVDTRKRHPAPISERLAREIAWRLGIVRIEEIALSGALWQIAGRDEDGNERVLDIDAHDGRVPD